MTKKNTSKSLVVSPLLKSKDIGHWKFPKSFRQSEWFGFIYCITRKEDGKFYIGKKQLNKGGRKTKTVKGKRVPNPSFGKTTDWRTYTGSSDTLNKDIKARGKEAFDFEIVDLYRTKGGLYYAEASLQMASDALPLTMPHDSEEYAAYNAVIGAVRFIPKELPTARTRAYANKVKKRIKDK